MRIFSRILILFKAKASSALDRVEDPRQVLDYAYAQQQEMLVRTKQGLVEVATSKVRLEQQATRLRDRVPRTEDQAMRALTAGREDTWRGSHWRASRRSWESSRSSTSRSPRLAQTRRGSHRLSSSLRYASTSSGRGAT